MQIKQQTTKHTGNQLTRDQHLSDNNKIEWNAFRLSFVNHLICFLVNSIFFCYGKILIQIFFFPMKPPIIKKIDVSLFIDGGGGGGGWASKAKSPKNKKCRHPKRWWTTTTNKEQKNLHHLINLLMVMMIEIIRSLSK